jgi:hypothetical protein
MQEDVSDAKSRFLSTGLLNLVVRAKFQQVLLCPSLPNVLNNLLMESEFLCQSLCQGRLLSRWDSFYPASMKKVVCVNVSGPSSCVRGVS